MIFLINAFYYQYPGNLYFPSSNIFDWLIILLIWAGCILQFGKNSSISNIMKEIFHMYLLILIIAISSTAVQFTPFQPIDRYIQTIEAFVYINMDEIVKWTNSYPIIYTILSASYNLLSFELLILPLIIIISRNSKFFYEFMFLMLVSSFIGFVFYYFFPTTAPASLSSSPFFLEEQRATGLKFYEIHQHIEPSTIAGGMIALPSFHVIWACWLQYMVRAWPVAFFILLPFNILLIISCVLLGWHYPLDIIGSALVIYFTYKIYCSTYCKEQKLK